MEYDYTGMRVKKNAPSGISLYPFQGYEIDPNGIITKFIRVGIETFASKKGTNKYFYHNDHLGGVNVITDIAGTQVQLNEYDPWGSVSRASGSIDPTHRFNGKELDPETGLYYYGGRYYDPEISRFISPDPFVPQASNPQSLNRYSYVLNNPQNYVDPSGYFFKKLFKAIGKAFKKLWNFTKKAWTAVINSVAGRIILGTVITVPTAGVLGPAGLGLVSASMANALGGALAGATLSGITGGNPLIGALTGFVVAGGLGGGIIGGWGVPTGNSWYGIVGSEIVNVGTRGFVVGTLGALASGASFSNAIQYGGLSAAIHLGGITTNNIIGHIAGLIRSGGNAPTIITDDKGTSAFFYSAPGRQLGAFGNVVSGDAADLLARAATGNQLAVYNVLKHEVYHIPQSGVLGIGYGPLHGLFQATSWMVCGSTHSCNPLERHLHPYPSY